MEERVRQLFAANIETKISLVDEMSETIAKAGNKLVNCLLNDGKILLCGIGASGANCLHFSSAMLSSFEVERPPLPAIVLSADIVLSSAVSHDAIPPQFFSRQIQALGQEGDVLLVLSTTGKSSSLVSAVNSAHDKGIDVIALNGRDGGVLASRLGPEDIELRVVSEHGARIREVHLFILHSFCDLIDKALFDLG